MQTAALNCIINVYLLYRLYWVWRLCILHFTWHHYRFWWIRHTGCIIFCFHLTKKTNMLSLSSQVGLQYIFDIAIISDFMGNNTKSIIYMPPNIQYVRSFTQNIAYNIKRQFKTLSLLWLYWESNLYGSISSKYTIVIQNLIILDT